jgi:Galactose oxidase, central domain
MRFVAVLVGVLVVSVVSAAEENRPGIPWHAVEKAVVVGQRWDIPIGYASELKQFVILGGRTSFAEYRKPRPYDVLMLGAGMEQWENAFPMGKEWGPRSGPCQAPAWKDEVFGFQDSEKNIRPNWTVYGTFSLGQKYDYDPDTKCFYFYAGGRTFRYDPAAREWKDLEPAHDPQKDLGGVLLWSSMCYDRHNKRFLLFGGGNVQTPRGDPGTWTYTPATNTWTRLELDVEPPQRANSRLVYDPTARKVVLFGGDQLDQLLADTWTFDVVAQKWEEKNPVLGPAPRAGHALLWLPKAHKVLLLGGYTYTSTTDYVASLYQPLPLEAWLYDTTANRWELLHHIEKPQEGPRSSANGFLSAAAAEDDRVLVFSGQTWATEIDASKTDATGTTRHGVAQGSVVRRTGPHDPKWYQEGVPAADPDKVVGELKDLPSNRWMQRPTPKLAAPNMDWGSAVFAPELDLILRFSGGHSAYSGTAPQIYNVKTDRYSIPFAPEYPIEYVYSNDQVRGVWSFKGNPWMTGHTYKSTGYEPRSRSLVFAPHTYTYFFDPLTGKWSRSPERNPYRPDFYVVTVCATPEGAVVWADRSDGGAGLWRLEAKTRTWKPLPVKGELPTKSPDHHGLAYDAKRNRLLFFSDLGKNKGDVAEYDFQTGQVRWLEAQSKNKALAPSRETIYLPELDMVLIGAHVKGIDGQLLWLAYDCGRNAWMGIDLGGADPIGKGMFNNSMGLMFDPNRKLVWAVGQNSHVYVLRLDLKKAKVEVLK